MQQLQREESDPSCSPVKPFSGCALFRGFGETLGEVCWTNRWERDRRKRIMQEFHRDAIRFL